MRRYGGLRCVAAYDRSRKLSLLALCMRVHVPGAVCASGLRRLRRAVVVVVLCRHRDTSLFVSSIRRSSTTIGLLRRLHSLFPRHALIVVAVCMVVVAIPPPPSPSTFQSHASPLSSSLFTPLDPSSSACKSRPHVASVHPSRAHRPRRQIALGQLQQREGDGRIRAIISHDKTRVPSLSTRPAISGSYSAP